MITNAQLFSSVLLTKFGYRWRSENERQKYDFFYVWKIELLTGILKKNSKKNFFLTRKLSIQNPLNMKKWPKNSKNLKNEKKRATFQLCVINQIALSMTFWKYEPKIQLGFYIWKPDTYQNIKKKFKLKKFFDKKS